jgi:phytanoyl-CoA hydroxylase
MGFFRNVLTKMAGPSEILGSVQPKYHSRFGGMWIDREDWRRVLRSKRLHSELARLIETFVEDGVVIIPGAADIAAVNAFQNKIARSVRQGNPDILYMNHGGSQLLALKEPVDGLKIRVVDVYGALPEALDLFSSPRLLEFLSAVFAEDPLLIQSLSFDKGSQQGLHQDTAYVRIDRPMELAACWIALEDISPGSGELMYVPGSHRLPDWTFGEGRKHWSPSEDGNDIHAEWERSLIKFGAERGVERFLARKGDILVWHADLAHGGSPVTDPTLTRQSLVGHFCPQSARPVYPRSSVLRRHGRLAYSSNYYDLR